MNRYIQVFLCMGLLGSFFCTAQTVSAQDLRSSQLDIYIIIDNAPRSKLSSSSFLHWLNEELIAKRLKAGDRLTLVLAATGTVLFDRYILSQDENLSNLSEQIQSIKTEKASLPLSESIKKTQVLIDKEKNNRQRVCFFMLSTLHSLDGDPNLIEELRYSHVKDYSGWKLFSVADGTTKKHIQRLAQIPLL